MKVLALCGFVLLFGSGVLARNVGSSSCTWGPSYWCENIPQAKECKAFQHCKQTIWETHTYPVDNDEICKICLDMVKQARDQLLSNETQTDLRLVFEGSCNLIPIKVVRKECIKLADDFVPELVEALSSQMDPTAVCSIAGLCNNAKIDKMLLEAQQNPWSMVETKEDEFTCPQCDQIGGIITNKFNKADPDDVLEAMLNGCGKLSSYSDACSSIVLIHFEEIYGMLKKNLNKDSICHLSGVCTAKFHQHKESLESEEDGAVQIRPMSNVGFVHVGDDIPCELCQQLVKHLRDIVVTNTTETEFLQILRGICGQMKDKLKDQCLSVVNEYFKIIYEAIKQDLEPKLICGLINICSSKEERRLIMPLLPVLEAQKIQVSLKKVADPPKRIILGENEPSLTKAEIEAFQLPFDHLMGPQNADLLVENGQLCTICEMVLHFLQEVLSNPQTEDQIKQDLDKACQILPKSVRSECEAFVSSYGDAVVALIVQDIDPSAVCPMLKMCSQKQKEDVEIFATNPMKIKVDVDVKGVGNAGDKPTCPLCLLAVQEAKNRIQNDKSMENIKRTLDSLCIHLPTKLSTECVDFVDTYYKQLIDMLIKDITPQEICTRLKLCTESPKAPNFYPVIDDVDDILTNEIPDNTVNGMSVIVAKVETRNLSPNCVICKKVAEEIEKKIVNKHSREEIKHVLEHVCDKVEKKMKDKCVAFIQKHEDQIVDLIIKDVTVKELCTVLGFCFFDNIEQLENDNLFIPDLDIDEAFSVDFISLPASAPHERFQLVNKFPEVEPPQDKPPQSNQVCILCEFVMTKLEKDLQNATTEAEIRHAVESICHKMPKTIGETCTKFVDNYADMIISLLATTPPAKICEQLKLCIPPADDVSVEGFLDESKNDLVECAFCQSAVMFVDKLLEDPNFDNDIEKVVEHTCNLSPKLYRAKCNEFVRAYAPSMINLLLAKGDPNKVCEELKLCYPKEISAFIQMGDDLVPTRIRRDIH